MQLKRHYAIPEGWEPVRDAEGRLTNPLPVEGISVKHTGTHATQNFSRRLVDAGIAEGWMSMSRGMLTLHAEEEDLTYTILRMPGMYCCHCDAKLEDDPSGATGRAHLAAEHAGTPSPDPSNPAGFRVTNAYECELDEEQHARWNGAAVAMQMSGATTKKE
jgi:hypothetical protein